MSGYKTLSPLKVNDLIRNIDRFKGQKFKYYCTITSDSSIHEGYHSVLVNSNMDNTTVEILATESILKGNRLVRGDSLTVYGTMHDLRTYITTENASNTVPQLIADEISFKGSAQQNELKALWITTAIIIFILILIYNSI